MKLFLGYMLSLNVALPVLSWLWASGRQLGSPRRPNEWTDAFMCALNALHEIVIYVWYSWLYIRGLKKHRFVKPISMSHKCVATHQMCYLFSCNLQTNSYYWTRHSIPLRWTRMNKPGWEPVVIDVWGGCSVQKADWLCGRSWIRWQFKRGKWYACWFVFCVG